MFSTSDVADCGLPVTSSLELASKNIVCGSVRMVYALIYTLFLVRSPCNPGYLQTLTRLCRALDFRLALTSTCFATLL